MGYITVNLYLCNRGWILLLLDIAGMALISALYAFIGVLVIFLVICLFFEKKITDKYIDADEDDSGVSNKPKPLFYFIAVPLFLLIFGYTTMKAYWGNDTIGSVFARSNFNTTYYVNVFENSNNAKNYRFKADVTVEYSEGERIIILKKVYFPNDGYLIFKDTDYMITNLKPYEKVRFEDDNGNEWYIELTNEKV